MTARLKPTICSPTSLRNVMRSDDIGAQRGRLGAQVGDVGFRSAHVRHLGAHVAQKLEDEVFGVGAHGPMIADVWRRRH